MSHGHMHGGGAHHRHAAAGEQAPGGHAPGVRRTPDGRSARRLAIALALTATVMVAEVVGGLVSGSLALLSDAGHMLTDAGALALALVAAWLSERPADDKRTFGYRRAEVLAAQLNVGALFVLNHDHSLNARSAFLHVLSDTISSVAILVGAGAIVTWSGTYWIDPVLSLGIALLILLGATRLILEITEILMESAPRHIDMGAVGQCIGCCPGVMAVHDVHVWTISSGLHALSAHVVVRRDQMGPENDAILDEVKRELREKFGIDHTTLQIESSEYAHVYELKH